MLKRAYTVHVTVLFTIVAAICGNDNQCAYSQTSDPTRSVAQIGLTDQNYADWRDHILPKQSELGWERIPWLTTFKDGILAANDAGKPLLFWTMNGHPLGCT